MDDQVNRRMSHEQLSFGGRSRASRVWPDGCLPSSFMTGFADWGACLDFGVEGARGHPASE